MPKQPDATNRDRGGKFKRGCSGNPAGRPRKTTSGHDFNSLLSDAPIGSLELPSSITDLLWKQAELGRAASLKMLIAAGAPPPTPSQNKDSEGVAGKLADQLERLRSSMYREAYEKNHCQTCQQPIPELPFCDDCGQPITEPPEHFNLSDLSDTDKQD